MGKDNRARRAAKLRDRQARAAQAAEYGSTRRFAPPTDQDILRVLPMAAASIEHQGLADRYLAQFGQYDEHDQAQVDRCLQGYLQGVTRTAWERGWTPMDVVQHARRRLEAGVEPLLLAVIASEHRSYSDPTIDPRWLEQLGDLEIRRPFGQLELTAWAEGERLGRFLTLHTALTVAGFLQSLPVLARLLPLPGSASSRTGSAGSSAGSGGSSGRGSGAGGSSAGSGGSRLDGSGKMLARVRALLAKAEATDFPDEAEALSAKAQELMAKFSLDHALLDAGAPELAGTDDTGARRIWVETPYVAAKAQLVGAVASANRCRTVSLDQLAVVTIVGAELDLQLTELLSTSLLVQANRAMLAAGTTPARHGDTRSRSFRQSFLMAYAQRIGERLQATTTAAQSAVPDAERLLPVLAHREQQVEAHFTKLFPQTTVRRTRITNPAGWSAGLTAADLARLDTHPQLKN